MARLPLIDPERMTPEQRAVCEEVLKGPRERLPAPLRAWIHSPELARKAQDLGAFARYGTSLPPQLSELAILVTARHCRCEYEWYAHEKEAREAGLDPAVIAAILHGDDPELEGPAGVVHAVAIAMHTEKRLHDDLYEEAIGKLGTAGLAELIAIIGYYTLVAMTLNGFEIGLPDGTEPPFTS